MAYPRDIHLFNCDRTYSLDAVEDWLRGAKAKLGFVDFSIKQHYFTLPQMSEMSSVTIPALEIDLAVFVVHAHESRLSINEDNAGIGYAKIYRALQQRTGNRVIIVIGGDDNYKDEDEEDREVISRWARRKVTSQFSDEFMDGRKGFIFSWDKKHRKIHEEALRHFLDSSKKGKKFEHQPPKRERPPQQPPPRGSQHSRKKPAETKTQQRQGTEVSLQSDDFFKENSTDSRCRPGASDDPLTGSEKKEQQQAKPKQRSDTPRRDELYEEKKPECGHPAALHGQWTGEMKTSPETKLQQTPDIWHPLQFDDHLEEKKPEYRRTSSSHGRENPPPFPESTKIEVQKDLSVLGWNAKPESLSAVKKLIQKHRDQLKLDDDPDVYNADLQDLISYLENNPLTYCVLVVDAKKVSTVAHKGVAGYLKLLEAAERNVEVKIIVIVCCPLYMSKVDDKSLDDAIQSALNDSDKLFFARLRNGELTIKGDDLVFLFTSSFAGTSSHSQQQSHASGSQQILSLGTSQLHAQVNSTTGLSQGFQNQTACSYNRQYAPQLQAAATANKQFYPADGSFNYKLELPPLKTIMVLTRLRDGIISNRPEDVEYWKPGFIVPDHMERYLLNHFWKKSDVGLAILQERDELVSLVDKKIEKQQLLELQLDEFVVLKTRLKNGRISYEPKHIVFHSRHCEVPRYVSSKLRQDYGTIDDAELFVTSDSEGNFRQCIVRNDTGFCERLKSRVKTGLDRFQGKCN